MVWRGQAWECLFGGWSAGRGGGGTPAWGVVGGGADRASEGLRVVVTAGGGWRLWISWFRRGRPHGAPAVSLCLSEDV